MMLISEMRVVRPGNLAEALALLAEHGAQARPLAGGTDAMPRVKEGQWRVPLWLDIRRLPELTGVAESGGMVEVGAAAPFGRLLRDATLQRSAPLLLQALRDVGSVQIRAAGTIGGNLGTASPAGDSLPPLCALEAEVGLISAAGERWVPLDAFCLGPGRTARRPDELIRAVRFAAQPAGERCLWQKLGLRGAQAIAVVSLAIRLRDGAIPRTVDFARFAFGAVGPTVLRARQSERMIMHAGPLDEGKLLGIGQLAWREVLPISDPRASAEYRQQMAAALLQRGLVQLFGSPVGSSI